MTARTEIERLSAALPTMEVEALRKDLKTQTAKAKRFWLQKCEQLLAHKAAIEQKDECIAVKNTEITRLRNVRLEPLSTEVQVEPYDTGLRATPDTELTALHSRRGKAPPVDPFRGNDPEIRLDDAANAGTCSSVE